MWLATSACAHSKEIHKNAGIRRGARKASNNADHRVSRTGHSKETREDNRDNRDNRTGHSRAREVNKVSNNAARRGSNSVGHKTGHHRETVRSVLSRTGRHSKEVHKVRHKTGLHKTSHLNHRRKILIKYVSSPDLQNAFGNISRKEN
jgi:hypothetical protein